MSPRRTGTEPTFERHLEAGWAERALVDDTRRGLSERPRRFSPRWLYDARGSELFEQITRLPEYYPTEAERSILARESSTIARLSGADTLIELGSGTSDKTRLLIDAFWTTGQLRRFVPFDVSESTLRESTAALAERYPGLVLHGIVGDFTVHLSTLPQDGTLLVAFLGSTIGNFYDAERHDFLSSLAANIPAGAWVLLGVDLVKSVDRLVAAYDDPGGITAQFTLNLLHVLNRELGADFDPDAFEYIAFWDPLHERMDLRLRAIADQQVHVPGAGVDVEIANAEEIQVEISAKFRLPAIVEELAVAGFDTAHTWTDERDDVALVLARLRAS